MDSFAHFSGARGEPYRVGFLMIEGFALMSYASVAEPMRAANLLAGQTLFAVSNHSVDGLPAASSNRVTVPADTALGRAGDALPELDMLMVVAGGDPDVFLGAPVHGALRALDKRGVVLGGVSGGPLVLAAAGLMAGRRVTAHWEHMPALAETAPDAIIERSLYVLDRNRATCAGGVAPLDMVHALIARMHGAGFARKVSDWFLHTDIRPSEGAQRAGLIERHGTTNRVVIESIRLMQDHFAEPLALGRLAELAGVSPRQLSRLFQTHLGTSPMAFYLDLRLEHARHLLRASSLSITEIALAAGFSGSAHFSAAFAARHGLPPSRFNRAP